MELLNWLLGVAYRVYQWFGNEYNTLYNNARNVWNWASDLAHNAYVSAVNYAYSLFQNAQSNLDNLPGYIQSLIQNALRGINEDMRGLFDWVAYTVQHSTDFVDGFVHSLVDPIWGWVESVPGSIRGWVNGRINDAVNSINNTMGWVSNMRTQLQNLIATFTPANIQSFLDFIQRWYVALVQFLDDPLYLIYTLAWPSFLTFVCFLLAYMLGTTNRELPKKPTFRKDSLPK